MSNIEFSKDLEQESLAIEITNQLNLFMADNPHVPLSIIAELLGARNFFTMIDPGGKNKTPAYHLNVRAFVQDLKIKRQLQKMELPTLVQKIPEIILQPDAGEIISGAGIGLEKRGFIPRSRYLMELLAELNLPYEVYDGQNTPNMMRQLSYKVFVLSTIGKLVLVCNEEGNATFVVHKTTDGKGENEPKWKKYAQMTKEQLKELGGEYVSVVIYDKMPLEWKEEVARRILNGGEAKSESGSVTEDKNGELVPAGWMTVGGLARELKRGNRLIKSIAEKYRSERHEWFKRYKNESGYLNEYFHPDLARFITEELSQREKAPEGWMTVDGLRNKLVRSYVFVATAIKKYRIAHPEWFKAYETTTGYKTEHLHPELIQVVTEELSQREKAQDGWMTVKGLARESGRSDNFIKLATEKFRTAHPEWFKMFENDNGRMVNYIHPKLMRIITEELSQREKAPDGWMIIDGLTKEFGRNKNLIRLVIKKYKTTHPEWFKMFENDNGRMVNYIHPKLMRIITEELSQRKKAQDGWMTVKGLARESGRSDKFIKSIAEQYRSEHPEWFQTYEDNNNTLREHLHPELVRIISEKHKRDI